MNDRHRQVVLSQSIIGDTAAKEQLADTFLQLADRADAEKAVIAARVEPVRIAAEMLKASGDLRTATALYEWLARQYRRASFGYIADDYERQAKACRSRRRTGK